MNKEKVKNAIVFLSPSPPPYMGPSVATDVLLNSKFVKEFSVIHIDTADRRSLSNLGRIDPINVCLAFKHYALLIYQLIFSDALLVYLPISQTSIGFLRDTPFVLLSKLLRRKVILHLRGGHFREFYNSSNGIVKIIVKVVLRNIDRMIVLGHSLEGLFDGLVPEEKLSVVPNGLDIVIDSEANEDATKEPLTVLFLSNLQETKGFKEVLNSAPVMTAKYAEVKYVFGGEWRSDKDKAESETYVKDKKIEGSVEFKGLIQGDEKIRLLRNADIFVFPTYYPMEGHPWVIVEAMAAGLPIITTDQGCIRESVIDGENGFIIPKRNPHAIAERLMYLIEHPEAMKKMGRRSRQLYEGNFTKAHFVQGMISAVRLTLDAQCSN